MILFSHPTGNANVRQAAMALEEAGLLGDFWTCVAWDPDSLLNRWIPKHWRQQLLRRTLPASLRSKVRTRPMRETARHICAGAGLHWLMADENKPFSIDSVYRSLDRCVARQVERMSECSAVYCYEDGAFATFKAARQRGLPCLYDLPIGYWRAARAIYEAESHREPDWAVTLSGTFDSREKLARKDEELKAADLVIVASSFTKQTLLSAGIHDKPVAVIPYGSPQFTDEPTYHANAGKLRVLFVGSLGQRKGLSYLLKAVDMLKARVELTLLGRKTTDNCGPLNEATQKYHWIPSLSHADVLKEMSCHDVLVFPSLFEGFGLVILEAMSRGIPVIATPNTAGPDVIRDGEDGFIVPICSDAAIACKLEELARSPQKLRDMKHAALDRAQSFAWENYRNSLVQIIHEVLSSSKSANMEIQ